VAVSIALICVLGYLLGGINGAILLSKLVEKDDVRRHGSGNAGFTNFFRNYGKRTSLLVILIDAAKASASCLLGGWLLGKYGLGTEGMLLGGLAATLGHDFPAFLGFRGGKGIVCGFAAALVTDWRVGLILFAVFALVYFLTHYVSLASVLCALGFFVSFWLFYPGRPFVLILSGCLSALAIFLHRENIGRLVRGQERKTYFFKRGETK
jgi:glycerol-3-phosphate acyltransferase PlsY